MSIHQITPAAGSIIAVCVVAYLYELVTKGQTINKYAFNPSKALSNPITWFTSLFLHAMTPLHLLFNMFALYNTGPILEKYLGTPLFLVVYFASGFGGNFVYYLWAKSKRSRNVAVGASGAIYGLVGALGVLTYLAGGNMNYLISSFASMLLWSFSSRGIAWQAHLGGFITGGMVIFIITRVLV